ncbi:MAG TPA: hypothetical protein PKC59_06410 [Burkholderiaceae bacterium]|nr:hypothetical protein [Burkholderiaceae bacterium]
MHFSFESAPWDADNPGPAMKELKSTIRASLPAEAKMEDERLS